MTDEQKAMYAGICTCYNTQLNLLQSRSWLFTLINLAGLPIITIRPVPGTFFYVSNVGFLLCYLWIAINRQSKRLVDYWESLLASIDPPETHLFVFRVFSGRLWEKANEPFAQNPFVRFIVQLRLDVFSYFFLYLWLFILGLSGLFFYGRS